MHAALTLPAGTSAADRGARVREVLSLLGIGREEDTLVGGFLPGGIAVPGLSGGERKRLGIATGARASGGFRVPLRTSSTFLAPN